MHCEQNDREKYENLGKFIYNNYRQALEILAKDGPLLETMRKDKGFTGETYERWMDEERQWLEDLRREPEADSLRCLYLEALEKLWAAE